MTASTVSVAADRIAEIAERSGLDGILLLSPQSFTFATGVRVPTQASMRWRYAAALVSPAGLEAVVCVDMEESTVRAEIGDVPVYVWREFHEDAMAAVARMVAERLGTGATRLGVEGDFVPLNPMDSLSRHLPHVEWVRCEAEIARARVSKTPAELAVLTRLARACDDALATALDESRAGDSEFEIGRRIVNALYSEGIGEHRTLIVASGDRSWFPNVGPSDRVVAPGEVVRVEVFAGEGGYQAGVARTAVVGEPSQEVLDHWALTTGARNAALAGLRAGADAAELYRRYVDALGPLRERAIVFFGHGMGLEPHEPPYLRAGSTDPLQVGAVLGIEPFAMIPGKFGLQVKDVVSLTETGYVMLSDRLDGAELATIKV